MIEIHTYTSDCKSLWDGFVRRAKNGSFLFFRDYMEYHADRFLDSSLLFFEDNRLIAIMPANMAQNILYSHSGLTFGGIVSDHEMRLSLMLQLFGQLVTHLRTQDITKIVYKAIPYVYHKIPAEEDLYALFRFNARLTRRDASSLIFLESTLQPRKGKRRGIRRARKKGVVVRRSSEFKTFMLLLQERLRSRYNIDPTHSGDEMDLLARRFPNNIKLFAAYINDDMLAGIVTYENENIVHVQYMGATEQGSEAEALGLVASHVINEYSGRKKYFDFGISTEQNGRYLNSGLAYYKESWGARSLVYDSYEIDLV